MSVPKLELLLDDVSGSEFEELLDDESEISRRNYVNHKRKGYLVRKSSYHCTRESLISYDWNSH